MQSSPSNSYPTSLSDSVVGNIPGSMDFDSDNRPSSDGSLELVSFEGHYIGQMEMMADAATVANYLDIHQEWFRRCAAPMEVEPISKNGYALIIGHFGALGYEIEPKVGLHLLPQDKGIYRIETIPVPDYVPPGYDVDFNAALELAESSSQESASGLATQVEWELHLSVGIQFPRFIHALPKSLVKASGDKLLNQVVRQVSKRLTRKVQEDFHQVQNLTLPKSYHRHRFWTGWATGTATEE